MSLLGVQNFSNYYDKIYITKFAILTTFPFKVYIQLSGMNYVYSVVQSSSLSVSKTASSPQPDTLNPFSIIAVGSFKINGV